LVDSFESSVYIWSADNIFQTVTENIIPTEA